MDCSDQCHILLMMDNAFLTVFSMLQPFKCYPELSLGDSISRRVSSVFFRLLLVYNGLYAFARHVVSMM